MFSLILISSMILSFHFVWPLPFTDKCLKVKEMDQFDIYKFSGKWYEILRNNISIPVTTKCHEETYDIPRQTFIVIAGRKWDPVEKDFMSIEGVAANNLELPGTMTYNFPSAHTIGVLSVIDTDYETYAALFTCNMYDVVQVEHFWIVSRERNLSRDIIQKLLLQYKAMGGDVSSVIYINHTDCPY